MLHEVSGLSLVGLVMVLMLVRLVWLLRLVGGEADRPVVVFLVLGGGSPKQVLFSFLFWGSYC